MGIEVAIAGHVITPMMAAAGVGIAGSIYASEQSRKQSKKASRAQRRMQARENQRQQLAQIRQSKIASAQIMQAGANTGTSGASSVQGGMANVQMQSAQNVSFLTQMDNMQQAVQRRQEKAAQYAGLADTFQAAGNFAASRVQPTGTGGTKPANPNTL